MKAGGLTIGGPGTEHIVWRSIETVAAERLDRLIAERSHRIDFAASERRLRKIAAESQAEMRGKTGWQKRHGF